MYTDLVQSLFKVQKLAFLNDQVLVVEIFDYIIMLILIYLEDDGFDGCIALNEDSFNKRLTVTAS